jgi:ribonuclease-3
MSDLSTLCSTLAVPDMDHGVLRHALTHRSYAYENGGIPHNERLEFLGDSVLGIVVTDRLFKNHPDLPEGQLAKLRAAVVSAKALAVVAGDLGIGDYLLLGRGEETSGGRLKSSILSDAMEAIIGAVYIEFGLERAFEFVRRIFDPVIAQAADLGAGLDWKTSLQEISANHSLGVPAYELNGTGPDHDKIFTARVVVGEHVFEGGRGRSKKEAEQMVAEIAWRSLSQAYCD